MDDASRNLKWKLWADSTQFKRGVGDAHSTLGKFQKTSTAIFKQIGAAAASLGLVFSAGVVASFTKELVNLGGEATGVERAFKRIGNEDLLEGLRKSTHGTVSDLELMKRAVSANNFGIPIQNLGSLFEFAAARAQATGQSVDYLVDSIVTGIGRKSPLILDNLGITAVALKEKMGGVAMETATIGDVAKAVGNIASDELVKMGGYAETSATKIGQISAAWANFKKELSTSDSFLSTVNEGLTEMQMLMTGYVSAWDLVKGSFSDNFWKEKIAGFEEWKKQQEYLKQQAKYDGMYGEGESTTPPPKGTTKPPPDEKNKKKSTEYEKLTEQIDSLIKKQQVLALQNKDISGITTQIEALKKQKETVDKLIESENQLQVLKNKGIISSVKGGDIESIISQWAKKGQSQTDEWGRKTIQGSLADMPEIYKQNAESASDYFAKIQDQAYQVTSSIKYAFEDMAIGVAESIGSLAAGGGSMEEVAQSLINPIANLAIELGSILVGVGIGIDSLKAALASLAGPVALAAGLALIALGSAAKAGIAKLGSSGSTGGYSQPSGTYDLRTSGYNQQTYGLKASAMKVEIVGETKIKNKDIYIAYSNAQSAKKMNT